MPERAAGTFLAAGIALLAMPTQVAFSKNLILSAIAGEYRVNADTELVDGTPFRADNLLQIMPVSENSAHVHLELYFYNAHSCDLDGVAKVKNGDLVYSHEEFVGEDQKAPCDVHFTPTGAVIRLAVNDIAACRAYCGVRAHIQGEFPLSARRPLPDQTRPHPYYQGARTSRDH